MKRLFKKLNRLEEEINKALYRLIELFFVFLQKALPQAFFDKKNTFIHKYKTFKESKKQQAIEFAQHNYSKISDKKEKIFSKLASFQELDLQQEVNQLVAKLKEYYHSKSLIEHFLTFYRWFLYQAKVKLRFFSQIPSYTYKLTFATIIIALVGFSITYYNSSQIYQMSHPTRKPASADPLDLKPEYYMYEERSMVVHNVSVPIFRESVKEIRTVTIEFSVRTTTRFAQMYLIENEHELKDYFYMHMEPIYSEFPTTEEGKKVIKDKIQFELNKYLISNKVEGQVESVNLIFIIAN